MRYRLAAPILILSSMLGACDRPAGREAEPAANAAGGAALAEAPVVRTAGDSSLVWAPCPEPFPAGCQLTVLHGDPARPNADILLRVPGGAVLPKHSHSSAERMVLVSGRLDVRFKGAQPARLEPGTYAYGPAGLPHTATCMATEPCQLFIAFEGPVDVVPYDGDL